MNKTIKVIALCGVLGTMAVSCQKENLVEENTNIVAQANTVRNVVYNVDGIDHRITLIGDDSWNNFLQHMFALAEEGHRVTFRNEDNTVNVATAKEIVTFSTKDKKKAEAWCEEMVEAGYEVSIYFDPDTNTYNCIAIN
jgi:uncharacterized cupredoxin-like copper-binding protein